VTGLQLGPRRVVTPGALCAIYNLGAVPFRKGLPFPKGMSMSGSKGNAFVVFTYEEAKTIYEHVRWGANHMDENHCGSCGRYAEKQEDLLLQLFMFFMAVSRETDYWTREGIEEMDGPIHVAFPPSGFPPASAT